MRTSLFVLLGVFCVIFAGCTTVDSTYRVGYDFTKIDKVAVIDVQGSLGSEAAENQIADFFNMELLRKGYAPIERSQIQALLKEQEFQASDLTTSAGAALAGRILNVPSVVVINIPKFDEEMSITAKMIDVEDGSILWLGTGSGTTGRTLSTIVGAAAGAGAGAVVAGEDNQTVGVIAGGVLGGVAGQALTPQKAQKAQQIIKKLCKSMPSRIATAQ